MTAPAGRNDTPAREFFRMDRLRRLGAVLVLDLEQVFLYNFHVLDPVSYTHLDVYKRQVANQ